MKVAHASVKNSVYLLVFMILLSRPSFASVVKQLTMKEMVDRCQFVFEGAVIAAEPRLESNGTRIKTYVTFEILDVVKGNYSQRPIELSFLGGTVGDLSLEVSDLHIPKLGEKGIYFVENPNERYVNPLCGWDQGHFLIVPDQEGIPRVTTYGGKKITGVGPGPTTKSGEFSNGIALGVNASEESVQPGLTVSEFKERVRRMVRVTQ